MKIDKNNYEAYFLDYLEGNLDESLVNDFIEFIRQNPELKEELVLFDSVTLESEDLEFEKKEALYKEIYDNKDEFDRAAIASVECDLSNEEQKKFEDYLSRNMNKQKEAELFMLTKLQADESVVFNKKNKLLHYSTGKVMLLWTGRVAAVLVLALTVYILIDRPIKMDVQSEQVAVIANEKKNTEIIPEKIVPEAKKEPKIMEPKKVESVPNEKIVSTKPVLASTKKVENVVENEQIVVARIPLEVPGKISNIPAAFGNQEMEVTLASTKEYIQNSPANRLEEQFLADIVKEKTGLGNLSLNKITKAGLKLVSTISKDKFTYETNNDGKITEVSFDTRLLAFSIPTGSSGRE